MKKILTTVICILATAFSIYAQNLPTTQIKNVKTGKKVKFNETLKEGRITVISFWATWCVPCKKEIKNISKKIDGWQKEVDFDYMTISIDGARAEGLVRSYALSQGWDFPYYIDANSDLKRSLNFQSVPFTMIVDKNGKAVWKHIGYEVGGEDVVFEKVKEIAAEK